MPRTARPSTVSDRGRREQTFHVCRKLSASRRPRAGHFDAPRSLASTAVWNLNCGGRGFEFSPRCASITACPACPRTMSPPHQAARSASCAREDAGRYYSRNPMRNRRGTRTVQTTRLPTGLFNWKTPVETRGPWASLWENCHREFGRRTVKEHNF